jgi:hypothetical protein
LYLRAVSVRIAPISRSFALLRLRKKDKTQW